MPQAQRCCACHFFRWLENLLRRRGISGAEGGEGELWHYFFAFGPVVVGVALEAARLGVLGAGSMALLAGGNAGEQDVEGFLACESFFMAAHTGETAVSVVIEFRMGHPTRRRIGGGDLREDAESQKGWRSSGTCGLTLWRRAGVAAESHVAEGEVGYRVAERAFLPEDFFGDSTMLGDPLRGRQDLNARRKRPTGNVAARIA